MLAFCKLYVILDNGFWRNCCLFLCPALKKPTSARRRSGAARGVRLSATPRDLRRPAARSAQLPAAPRKHAASGRLGARPPYFFSARRRKPTPISANMKMPAMAIVRILASAAPAFMT